MKKLKGGMFVALIAIMAGCSNESAKLARLESRIAALEQERDATRAEIAAMLEKVEVNQLSIMGRLGSVSNSLAGLRGLVIDSIQEELDLRIRAIRSEVEAQAQTRRPAAALAQPPVRAAVSPMKGGVPATVYDQIARVAAQDWPGNFEMQEYQIKNQVEAYQKLQAVR